MDIDYRRYQSDIEFILDKRHINGADYRAAPDGATGNGRPFSTLEACILLKDLNNDVHSPEMYGAAEAIMKNIEPDEKNQDIFHGRRLFLPNGQCPENIKQTRLCG